MPGQSAAIILANPDKTAEELYTFAFTPTKAVPIVDVNLTHGTGSEVNRFAVASITKHNHKPAIAYDCLYPLFSIDDPGLMIKLSPKQTRYVSIDSVNHVIEAATAVTANPLSILAGWRDYPPCGGISAQGARQPPKTSRPVTACLTLP